MKPKLIIFDMDGTMLDTEPISMEGWRTASEKLGFPITKEAFMLIYEKIIGRNLINCKNVMQEHVSPTFDMDAAYLMKLAHMDEHFKMHGIPIKHGLLPLLDALEEMNIKKCVATSTQKQRATHKLTITGLINRFHVVVGGDEVEESKPNPDIFLKAAELCKTQPKDCLVLEDSAAGVEGAFRAGMQVYMIPDMLQPSVKTREMATAIYDDLYAVISKLQ